MIYKIFHSFYPSKFHLTESRNHTLSSTIYISKNNALGEGNAIVKLEESNKIHLWIEATKSKVLTGYGAHGIRELQS